MLACRVQCSNGEQGGGSRARALLPSLLYLGTAARGGLCTFSPAPRPGTLGKLPVCWGICSLVSEPPSGRVYEEPKRIERVNFRGRFLLRPGPLGFAARHAGLPQFFGRKTRCPLPEAAERCHALPRRTERGGAPRGFMPNSNSQGRGAPGRRCQRFSRCHA